MHKPMIMKSQEEKYSTSEKELSEEKISKLDLDIYKILSEKGPLTRSQLAKFTGIARSTLYDGLLRLSLKNMVKKYTDSDHNSRGRPKVFFEAIQ